MQTSLEILIVTWLEHSHNSSESSLDPRPRGREMLEELCYNKCLKSLLVPVTTCLHHFFSSSERVLLFHHHGSCIQVFPPLSPQFIQAKMATHQPLCFHVIGSICAPGLVSIPSLHILTQVSLKAQPVYVLNLQQHQTLPAPGQKENNI